MQKPEQLVLQAVVSDTPRSHLVRRARLKHTVGGLRAAAKSSRGLTFRQSFLPPRRCSFGEAGVFRRAEGGVLRGLPDGWPLRLMGRLRLKLRLKIRLNRIYFFFIAINFNEYDY